MRTTLCIMALLSVLLAASCSQKVIKTPQQPPPTAGEAPAALFSEAEARHAGGDTKGALDVYRQYLDRFPRGPHAAEALMRTGAIHRSRGNLEGALEAYRRVIAAYPGSGRGADARVEILSVYYQQGAYGRVISEADQVLEHPLTDEQAHRAYAVLGDASRAAGRLEEAVRAYAAAFRFAPENRRAESRTRLAAAVAGLEAPSVVTLLGYMQDPLARGYLLVRLGADYRKAGNDPAALTTLSEFVDLYPDHPAVPEARALLAGIGQLPAGGRVAIGCMLPLSGPSAVFGQQALDGVEFALSRHHARGGTPSVDIIVKDTASDPRKASEAVRELDEARVVAIIGPVFTAPAAAAEAQRLEIPIVTISQKEDIARTGGFVFRNFFTPKMQVQALVAHAVGRLNLSRFAILYPEEKYGQTFMNLFWDAVIASGARVVGVESYAQAQTDFAGPIKKLAGRDHGASGIDFEALFIPDAPGRAGLILPQLAYNDVTGVQLFGTNLWHSDQLLKMAHPYAQGAVMPDIFFAGSDDPGVRSFVEGFSQAYGREPGFMEAILYDSAEMLIHVLGPADPVSRLSVREGLAGLKDFAGVTGATSFAEDGEALKSLYLIRVEGPRFVEIPR